MVYQYWKEQHRKYFRFHLHKLLQMRRFEKLSANILPSHRVSIWQIRVRPREQESLARLPGTICLKITNRTIPNALRYNIASDEYHAYRNHARAARLPPIFQLSRRISFGCTFEAVEVGLLRDQLLPEHLRKPWHPR